MNAQIATGIFTLGGVLVAGVLGVLGAWIKYKYDSKLATASERRNLYADLLVKMNSVEEMLFFPHNFDEPDYYSTAKHVSELRAAYREAVEATLAAELVARSATRAKIADLRDSLRKAYFGRDDSAAIDSV